MHVTVANGVELHYVEQGDGPPLMLLHGGMGDAGSWAHQLRTLSKHHRVIAYSRRYSSPNRNAESDAGHAIRHDVEDLLTLQDALSTGPAHLVGTSYGALVALAFALQHADRALSLVLAEPPLHGWVGATPDGRALYDAFIEQVWRPAAAAFGLGLERRAMQLLVDGMWGRPVFVDLPPHRIEAAMRNTRAMRALTLSADPFPDLPRSEVACLAVPVLLVQGEHASALHRRVMVELAGVLRRPMQVQIPCAGHGSPSENPEVFDAAVLAFLESACDPRAASRSAASPDR